MAHKGEAYSVQKPFFVILFSNPDVVNWISFRFRQPANSRCGAPPTSISTLPHSNYLRFSQRRPFLNRGEFLGAPATGRQISVQGMVVDRVVASKNGGGPNTEDDLSMIRQLGVIPE